MKKILLSLSLLILSILLVACNKSKYTISFESNGGSEVSSIILEANQNILEPTAPTKEGYTFTGWFLDQELTSQYTFNKMPNDNLTLYAKWNISSYTITFNSNGGNEITSITSEYNSKIILNEPTKDNHKFIGWYKDELLTQKFESTTMPAQDITIYAKWEINSYIIWFNSNGGSSVDFIIQTYNTKVTKPNNPVREGYTFDGWFSDLALTTSYVFDRMPAQDITLHAKWVINDYTISFETNGGTTISPIKQEYGSIVTQPSEPTRDGYFFIGWYIDTKLTQAYNFTTMPGKDLTLFAKWERSDKSLILGAVNKTIKLGASINLLEGIRGIDVNDKNMDISVNIIDTSILSAGPHRVTYTATDSNGDLIQVDSTLIVVDDSIENKFTFRDFNIVPDLKAPIKSEEDLIDYLYTMFNSGQYIASFTCETSCQDINVDNIVEDYFYIMFLNHSYVYVQYVNIEKHSDYILVKGSKQQYTDNMKNQVDIEADRILSEIINYDMSEYEMIKAIHDYINDKVYYDYVCLDDSTKCGNSDNAYGAFFEGKVICDGYSQAFDILARKLGIVTHRLPSVKEGSHIWNVVFLDGEWLHVDLTWDDSISRYEFFLLTTEELHQMDTSPGHQFIESFFAHN